MKEDHQVMPPLSADEYKALKEDIGEHGVLVPVVVDGEGRTIDGHHRLRAWEELKAEGRNLPDYPVEVQEHLKTEEQKDLAWKLNMARRHLSRVQKQEVIADKLRQSPQWSDNRIAKLLGVHPATVGSVRRYLESTSQIEKFDRRIGLDNKQRPRSRSQEIRQELAKGEITGVPMIRDTSGGRSKPYGITAKHLEAWRKSREELETQKRVEYARKRISNMRLEIMRAEPEAVARLSLDPYQQLCDRWAER